jgi:hypothetical protein
MLAPAKQSIEGYALVNERFKPIAYLEESGTLASSVLEGFEMDVEQVFWEAMVG